MSPTLFRCWPCSPDSGSNAGSLPRYCSCSIIVVCSLVCIVSMPCFNFHVLNLFNRLGTNL